MDTRTEKDTMYVMLCRARKFVRWCVRSRNYDPACWWMMGISLAETKENKQKFFSDFTKQWKEAQRSAEEFENCVGRYRTSWSPFTSDTSLET